MAERLAHAISPYLRSHADNPVDWWQWGSASFEEARRRDVPVLISIGYSTCHWCHVMARESFSDPALAAYLNEHFVAIKIDREEHPDVDAAFLAAASAFTQHLGWPLTAITTPEGRTFFAGTYFPPRPVEGMPSFRQLLEAATDAWVHRRDEVETLGAAVRDALSARLAPADTGLPTHAELASAVARIAAAEDPDFGGIGTGSKFPSAPVLSFLAERAGRGDAPADELVRRLHAATRALQDRVKGGYFRYAVHQDWSEPHYERMLSDNAQLLDIATALGETEDAAAIAGFLIDVLGLSSGAFATAQDSESLVDGQRVEGGYYELDAAGRARQPRPAIDEKVLAGLNGLAIGALADAGVRFARPAWIRAASTAADAVSERHVSETPEGLRLHRASLGSSISSATATLEDYGGLAGGLVRLALAEGDADRLVLARRLVDACAGGQVPGGGDPVLLAHGLSPGSDRTDDASPSGVALLADAAQRLAALGVDSMGETAVRLLAPSRSAALQHPLSHGATLAVLSRLVDPSAEVVVIVDHETADVGAGVPLGDAAPPAAGDRLSPIIEVARSWARPGRTLAIVTPAQAAALAEARARLFESRTGLDGAATAYVCEGGVCRLPTVDAADLAAQLAT